MTELDLRELRSRLAADGFIQLPRLLDADTVAALRAAADDLLRSASSVDAENELFDLEQTHALGSPRVRRIKNPHKAHPVFSMVLRDPRLLELVKAILGPNLRVHQSKLNMKSARFGSPLEWHQDWAFIPHTNMSFAPVSVLLDDCDAENGPMLVLPGTHEGVLHDHHRDGYFVGAIDPKRCDLDFAGAVALTGPAGTVSVHHPLLVHGSALNRSERQRRLLFYEYAAADAWPLFYGVDFEEFNSRIVCGSPTLNMRIEVAPIRMPFPARKPGSVYNNQQDLPDRYFEPFAEISTIQAS